MRIFSYLGHIPRVHSKATVMSGVRMSGDVTIEEGVNIWFNASLRGDMAKIIVGKNTNIQDNAVIHTNTDMPTIIGSHITIGHGAIIHAATIHDHALIGMGAIILDGAIVEEYAMVGAGCLVPPGKVVPKNTLVVGNPMKIVRELTKEEIEANQKNVEVYLQMAEEMRKHAHTH